VAGRNSSQNEKMFLQKNLIGLFYYDPLDNVCIRVGIVWSGASKVRTKWSEVLSSALLACALLAHFASQVRT
jgi:hypothetical protein